MRKIATILAATAAALLCMIAADAGAALASTGGRVVTAEQAGYAVTGAQFRYAQQSVYLRNPANVAASLGGYGYSVQLWSSGYVIVLGVSASTSPASAYSPALAVFDPATHALICSTAASGTQECPGTPAAWTTGAVSYPAGDRVIESLYYNRGSGNVTATVHDLTAGHSSSATFDAGTAASFTAARLGAETGIDPWTAAPYTAPAAPARLASISGAAVTTYSGHASGLASWFTHAKVIQAPAATIQVAPSDLAAHGTAFTVTLQS